jgi:hypothetical protein
VNPDDRPDDSGVIYVPDEWTREELARRPLSFYRVHRRPNAGGWWWAALALLLVAAYTAVVILMIHSGQTAPADPEKPVVTPTPYPYPDNWTYVTVIRGPDGPRA